MQAFYTGIIWKHHISVHFNRGILDPWCGIGAGATVYLDEQFAREALAPGRLSWWNGKKLVKARSWHVCMAEVIGAPVRYEFDSPYIATLLIDVPITITPFVPYIEQWPSSKKIRPQDNLTGTSIVQVADRFTV